MTLLSDAFTAYLAPLLKKHSAGQPLVWEDLEASRAASQEVLKNSDNAFVSKRVEDLHQSQIQAYREAAVKALRDWAQSSEGAPLAPMEDNDTEDSFVDRCISRTTSWPNWRLDSAKMVVVMELRKRARATFAKYHPEDSHSKKNHSNAMDANGSTTTTAAVKAIMAANTAKNNDVDPKNIEEEENNNDDDEADDDDDDDEEDGEMDEDDDDDGDQDDGQVVDATKPSSNGGGQQPKASAPAGDAAAGSTNKKKASNSKNTGTKKRKVTVRKKGTNAKQTGQTRNSKGGGPSNRGRRSGRGGGAAGASTKSG